MERRWAERMQINLDVDVCYQGVVHGTYQTHDMSLGGVFIQTQSGAHLADAHVDLRFNLGSQGQYTKHRIKGKVVRVTDDGVGLVFREFDAVAFRSLQEVLRYGQPPTDS